jgi:hypothetical protein
VSNIKIIVLGHRIIHDVLFQAGVTSEFRELDYVDKSEREIIPRDTNRYNGMNRHGLPVKRGKS